MIGVGLTELAVALVLPALIVYFVFRNRVPLAALVLLIAVLSPILAFVDIVIVFTSLTALLQRYG